LNSLKKRIIAKTWQSIFTEIRPDKNSVGSLVPSYIKRTYLYYENNTVEAF